MYRNPRERGVTDFFPGVKILCGPRPSRGKLGAMGVGNKPSEAGLLACLFY